MATYLGKIDPVCAQCPSAYECGKLFCALEILAADRSPAAAHRDESYEDLLAATEDASFGYPDARVRCRLAGEERAIRDLTAKAILILSARRGRTLRTYAP